MSRVTVCPREVPNVICAAGLSNPYSPRFPPDPRVRCGTIPVIVSSRLLTAKDAAGTRTGRVTSQCVASRRDNPTSPLEDTRAIVEMSALESWSRRLACSARCACGRSTR